MLLWNVIFVCLTMFVVLKFQYLNPSSIVKWEGRKGLGLSQILWLTFHRCLLEIMINLSSCITITVCWKDKRQGCSVCFLLPPSTQNDAGSSLVSIGSPGYQTRGSWAGWIPHWAPVVPVLHEAFSSFLWTVLWPSNKLTFWSSWLLAYLATWSRGQIASLTCRPFAPRG